MYWLIVEIVWRLLLVLFFILIEMDKDGVFISMFVFGVNVDECLNLVVVRW